MQLTNDQQNAVNTFVNFLADPNQTVMVISGPPGTGKSTLTQYLVNEYHKLKKTINLINRDAKLPRDILVTATTNKAARVISDMVGCEPRTIYSLLGITLFNDYKTGKQKLNDKKAEDLVNALLFIDESSFLNNEALRLINKYLVNCKVVYLGDRYQLALQDDDAPDERPPVFDLPVTQVHLTEVVRNPGAIERMAAAYRPAIDGGQLPVLETNGVELVQCTGDQFRTMVDACFSDQHQQGIPDQYKLLAWTNDRVRQYNTYTRTMLGMPSELTQYEWVLNNTNLKLGQKRIPTDAPVFIEEATHGVKREIDGLTVTGTEVTINNIEEIFVPDDWSLVNKLLKSLASTKDWPQYFAIKETWADLRPNYACTVHKSQGSTYESVFIDLSDIGKAPNPQVLARLMNVAISRARKHVYFYGELPAHYQGIPLCSTTSHQVQSASAHVR